MEEITAPNSTEERIEWVNHLELIFRSIKSMCFWPLWAGLYDFDSGTFVIEFLNSGRDSEKKTRPKNMIYVLALDLQSDK